jgi:ribosomal protein S18 acetylase RimI-like enzyme
LTLGAGALGQFGVALVSRLEAILTSSGCVYGAWEELEVVGMAALDARGVNGDRTVLKLDMLYVSAGYRGRGVGRKLTDLLAVQAC